MKAKLILALTVLAVWGPTSPAAAEDNVLIPSQMELTDEQKSDLKDMLAKKVGDAVKECIAVHPRPEFFTSISLQFDLRKTGELRGGYLPGGAIDSAMYVKSDEERDKLKEEGAFARTVVRKDRDLNRCLKKATRSYDTKFDRISAHVDATYTVTWKGKTPSVEATTFEVKKG